ncbi:MAG TPA: carboxymuconolactone decarboxylase family protein [Streptosporangiaceae bacterium]|nr:carboxymuconolactone decarboxylase family protein [Streptosporangiaceae bacterium]
MTMPVTADVDADTKDALSGLSTGDVDVIESGLGLREQWQQESGLDARSFSLVKIAALVALDAPPASYLWQVSSALDSGATPSEILGVLRAIAPQVGGPKVVAAAPEIMVALGLSLPDGA